MLRRLSGLEYMQEFKGNVLVALVGVEDIDTAKKYKGMDVVVPEDMLPELEGEIYWHELEGAPVFDKAGEMVGTLVDLYGGRRVQTSSVSKRTMVTILSPIIQTMY